MRLRAAPWGTLEYARAEDWPLARASVQRVEDQVALIDKTQQPPRVTRVLHRATNQLEAAVQAKRSVAAQRATVDVAQSGIDLEARYLAPVDIEVARFHLHTQKLRVDAAVGDAAGVAGEVAALGWIRDRIQGSSTRTSSPGSTRGWSPFRTATASGALPAAADQATRLASDVRNFEAS